MIPSHIGDSFVLDTHHKTYTFSMFFCILSYCPTIKVEMIRVSDVVTLVTKAVDGNILYGEVVCHSLHIRSPPTCGYASDPTWSVLRQYHLLHLLVLAIQVER